MTLPPIVPWFWMCCVDMGKELDLQKACQNGDLHLVKKLLAKQNRKGKILTAVNPPFC